MQLNAIPTRRLSPGGGTVSSSSSRYNNNTNSRQSNDSSRNVPPAQSDDNAPNADIPPIMNPYKWKFSLRRLSQTYLLHFLAFIYFPLYYCLVAFREVLYSSLNVQQWWIHLMYILGGAITITIASVVVLALLRYCLLVVLRRYLRNRRRRKRIRPSMGKKTSPTTSNSAASKGKSSNNQQNGQSSDMTEVDIDAQLDALLGSVEDSSSEDDEGANLEEDSSAVAADPSSQQQQQSKKKRRRKRKKLENIINFELLSEVLGHHHGFTRDFLLRISFAILLFSGMIFSLAPYRVQIGFIDNTIVAWIYSVLMTLIFAHSSFSLIAKDTPELNQYTSFDWWNPFYRSFYLLLFLIVDVIAALSGVISSSNQETTQLVVWNQITHGAALFIPVGVAAGILPQPNVFITWAFELMQIYFHGGSPASSNSRLFIMALLSWSATLIVFVAYYFGSAPLGVLLAASLGFTLSHDVLLQYMMNISDFISTRAKGLYQRLIRKNSSGEEASSFSEKRHELPWHAFRLVGLTSVSLLYIVCSIGIGVALHVTSTHMLLSAKQNTNVRNPSLYASYGVEFLILVVFLVNELKRSAYSLYLFNLIRNPLVSMLKLHNIDDSSGSKPLHKALQVIRIAFQIFMGLLITVYYILFIDRVSIRTDSSNWFAVFAESMLMVRCFRWSWQNTRYAYAELILVAIIDKIPFGDGWEGFSFAAKLFLFGFVLHRFSTVLFDRLKFMCLMYVTPIQKRKMRFTNWQLVMIFNLVCFPCLVLVFAASLLLMAPLLPLLGLPLFLIGAPRPLRIWTPTGASYNECADSQYYKDMEPHVLRRLSQLFSGDVLMDTIQAGDILLLRSEFFLVWVEVVERGFAYTRFVFKGLELQTTSCHAEEATQLDDLTDSTFENQTPSLINKYFFHTFEPLCKTHIDSFTLSNISLVGIIDQPNTFDFLYPLLAQCMVWLIKQRISELDEDRLEDLSVFPFESFEIEDMASQFPYAWYNFIVNEDADSAEAWKEQQQDEIRSTSVTPEQEVPLIAPTVEDHVKYIRVESAPNTKEDSTEQQQNNANGATTSVSQFVLSSDEDESDELMEKDVPVAPISQRATDYQSAERIPLQNGDAFSHSQPRMKTSLNNYKIEKTPEKESTNDPTEKWVRYFVLSVLLALKKASMGEKLSTFRIYEIFSGESFAFDSFLRGDPLLYDLFLQAFRYAVYLRLESKIYALDETGEDFNSLDSSLETMFKTQLIQCSTDTPPDLSLTRDVTTFFTLQQEKNSLGTPSYKAKFMKRSAIPFYVGRLNAEAVRGIWANLQQELFYFTNDDDERLSIQAMSPLLRNITISAAEPPLGYPIYNSVSSVVNLV